MTTINLNEARQLIAESCFFNSQQNAESLLLRTLNKFYIHESDALKPRDFNDRRIILQDRNWGFKSLSDGNKFATWGVIMTWAGLTREYRESMCSNLNYIEKFGGRRYELPASVFSGGQLNNFSAMQELYGENNLYNRTHSSLTFVSPMLALAWFLQNYHPDNLMSNDLRHTVLQGNNLRAKLRVEDCHVNQD